MSSQIFLWPMKRAGCQLKLPDQVEKGHTSVLLAFRTPVQHRVNDLAASLASSRQKMLKLLLSH